MDRGSWQAVVHRAAKTQTRLKWLRTHAHSWVWGLLLKWWCLDAERGGGSAVCTDGHCLAHCDCWLYDMWVSPQWRARGGAQGKENLTHGQVKLFLCFLPSIFAEPSLEQGGADWAMCNAQVNRAQRPRTCPSWCYTRSLPYRSSTTLLISHMFACVINNACLEKSMCIIVFDLVMNFKAKDSIFSPPPFF